MAIGSSFLESLNSGTDTPGDVAYTSVYTAYDELVRPVTNAELRDNAVNVRVQSLCPFRFVGHIGLVLDATVYTIVRSALQGGPISADCWA
jgi:hypothetical protein